MKNAPIRHRLEFVFYRAAKRALVRGGSARAERLGRILGLIAYRMDQRRRETARRNVDMALPALQGARREEIVRSSFIEMLTAFAEGVAAAGLDESLIWKRFDVVGREHLPARKDGEKGFLLLGAHFGRWELAIYPLGLLFGGIDYVARPPDNPFIAGDLETIRNRFGNRHITRKGAGHRILNALRRGRVVALSIDQRVRPSQGISVPFFGRSAWTSPVPALVSIHAGVPVIPCFCLPSTGGRLRIELGQGILPRGEGPEEVERLTRLYNDAVESEVRQHPEHYLWMHRRWN